MLTIVVDSFDGYSDVWPSFFEIFNMQWGNCPYNVKLVSNYLDFYGVDTIKVGEETCWSDRTIKAIKQIRTEYVLLLLEDYLFGKSINNEEIAEALVFLKERGGQYLRLTNIPKSRFNDGKVFFPLYADEEYAINLQASIWRREFLIEALEKFPGSAWEFEIGFLKEAVISKHSILEGCFGAVKDPLDIHNGVLKGKWFPNEVKYFAKRGIDIQWKERGMLTFMQMIKYKISVGIKDKLSYKTRKKVKSVLKKFGMRFVSDL